jgi:hypothetical protein
MRAESTELSMATHARPRGHPSATRMASISGSHVGRVSRRKHRAQAPQDKMPLTSMSAVHVSSWWLVSLLDERCLLDAPTAIVVEPRRVGKRTAESSKYRTETTRSSCAMKLTGATVLERIE